MSPVRAVLLDLDETLIVDDAGSRQALRTAISRALDGRGVDVEALAVAIVRQAKAFWSVGPLWSWAHGIGISSREALVATFDHEGPKWAQLREGQDAYRASVYGAALGEQGLAGAAEVDALTQAFCAEHWNHRTLLPGALETLEALRPKFRLGLLTNGIPDLQRGKVVVCGIASWFDAIVVSGEVGAGKPEVAAFHCALERMGTTAQETVMVGDNLERDILGAHRSGMRSVWIDRTPGPAELQPLATRRISSISQLPAALNSL